MIPLLLLFIATLIAGIIASLSKNRDVHGCFRDLYRWGFRLIGKCITMIMVVNAIWLGLRTIGLLK